MSETIIVQPQQLTEVAAKLAPLAQSVTELAEVSKAALSSVQQNSGSAEVSQAAENFANSFYGALQTFAQHIDRLIAEIRFAAESYQHADRVSVPVAPAMRSSPADR